MVRATRELTAWNRVASDVARYAVLTLVPVVALGGVLVTVLRAETDRLVVAEAGQQAAGLVSVVATPHLGEASLQQG